MFLKVVKLLFNIWVKIAHYFLINAKMIKKNFSVRCVWFNDGSKGCLLPSHLLPDCVLFVL